MEESMDQSSKRRKLNPTDDNKDIENQPTNFDAIDEKDTGFPENQQSAENDLSKIDVPKPAIDDPPLSKNQLKKQKRKEQWEAAKNLRKDKRKDKRHEKAARKAQEQAELEEKIAKGEIEAPPKITPEESKRIHLRPVQVPVTLIVDCDFNDLMSEKELISMGAQLTRCYSDNRHSKQRAHIAISSWGGALQNRFETVLANAHKNWKGVKFMESDFVEVAKEMKDIMTGPDGGKLAGALEKSDLIGDALKSDEERIIYLTSDSPHTLDRLSPYTSYIIGGIVDKNRHKGLCYKRACEQGIPTAKLPIGEYMTMQSRTVLTTNHVVEIMLKWLETGDWGEAFLSVIPKRKEASLKAKGGSKGIKDGEVDNGEGEDGEGDSE